MQKLLTVFDQSLSTKQKPSMTKQHVKDQFDMVWVNTEVKNTPNPVTYDTPPSTIHTSDRLPPITTAYGLNEPQWTIGVDIPPLIYSRSPYARVPLPPIFKINPVLSFSSQLAVDWTIDQPPDSAVLALGYTHLDQYHWKTEPATDPATSTPIVVHIERLDFSVPVSPMGNVVTVGDVLTAVYVGARRCVTERMLTQVGVDVRIVDRFHNLVQEMPRARGIKVGDDEVSSNVRESTGYWTKWVGLAPSGKDDDVWCLYTKYLVG